MQFTDIHDAADPKPMQRCAQGTLGIQLTGSKTEGSYYRSTCTIAASAAFSRMMRKPSSPGGLRICMRSAAATAAFCQASASKQAMASKSIAQVEDKATPHGNAECVKAAREDASGRKSNPPEPTEQGQMQSKTTSKGVSPRLSGPWVCCVLCCACCAGTDVNPKWS